MIFSDDRERWVRNLTQFILISFGMLYLIYSIPVVADRPSAFYARLLNSAAIHYFDAYALQKMHFTAGDTVMLLWLHFLQNLRIFFGWLMSSHWNEGFKFFVISLGIVFVSMASLFCGRRELKSLGVFAFVTTVATLAAIFILYDYYGFTGSRLLLFILPFHVSVIVSAFLGNHRLPRKMTVVVAASLCVISFVSFWNTLGYLHKDFMRSDAFDNACVDFLDSLGASEVGFFSAPYQISLEYVNRHYPVKWSFLPSDERTLRLLSRRYPVDMLIVPPDHRLAVGENQNGFKRSLIDGAFEFTSEALFRNQRFLVYRRSSGT